MVCEVCLDGRSGCRSSGWGSPWVIRCGFFSECLEVFLMMAAYCQGKTTVGLGAAEN